MYLKEDMICEYLWYYRYPDIPSEESNLISNFDAWKLYPDFGLSKKWKIGPESEEGNQDYKPPAREYDGSGGDDFSTNNWNCVFQYFGAIRVELIDIPAFDPISLRWVSFERVDTENMRHFDVSLGGGFNYCLFSSLFGVSWFNLTKAYFSDGWFRVFSFIYGCFQTYGYLKMNGL